MEFCSLFSGSSGNCQYIKTENTTILVDAGLSGKKIQQEIVNIGEDPKKIDAIFITHEHIDHIQGAGIMSRRLNVPVYANKKISIVTDTGCINELIINKIMNSDLLLIESNHDEDMVLIGPYPWPLKRRVLGEFGHMSNDTAGDLISKVVKRGTEIVLLGHLSKENNFPQLAYKTVENILKENSIDVNPGICLEMTYRDKSSKIYEI